MRKAKPSQRILVLNGANLGRLGTREPELYGTTTHDQLRRTLEELGRELQVAVEVRQTDSEAELIKWLHEAADSQAQVVINSAAWSHYSHAVADAVAQCAAEVVEVHLTNIFAREEFRRTSVISPLATGVVAGLGVAGYELAIRWLVNRPKP